MILDLCTDADDTGVSALDGKTFCDTFYSADGATVTSCDATLDGAACNTCTVCRNIPGIVTLYTAWDCANVVGGDIFSYGCDEFEAIFELGLTCAGGSTLLPQSVGPDKVSSLQMTLEGVPPLSDDSLAAWIDVTEAWIIDFFVSNPQYGISDVETSIVVISIDPPLVGSRNRFLQTEQVTLTYDQTVSYTKSPSSTLTSLEVITHPFESEASRDEYMENLYETGVKAFENILRTSVVSQAPGGTTQRVEPSSGSDELPVLLPYFAALAVGMGVLC